MFRKLRDMMLINLKQDIEYVIQVQDSNKEKKKKGNNTQQQYYDYYGGNQNYSKQSYSQSNTESYYDQQSNHSQNYYQDNNQQVYYQKYSSGNNNQQGYYQDYSRAKSNQQGYYQYYKGENNNQHGLYGDNQVRRKKQTAYYQNYKGENNYQHGYNEDYQGGKNNSQKYFEEVQANPVSQDYHKGKKNKNNKNQNKDYGVKTNSQNCYEEKEIDEKKNRQINYQEYDNQEPSSTKYQGKNKEKFYVIEKDVTDVKLPQDKEDDYLDDETLDALEGEEYYEDDKYYEDDGNYYEDVDDLSNNFESKNSIKNKLLFKNNESFTAYVDNMIKSGSGYVNDNHVNVLMIAEKPSIAKSIAEALSGKFSTKRMGKGNGSLQFEGYFGETKAQFTVSSVMGHVYGTDFQREHNKWDSIDYLDLYDVPIEKTEANRKTKIPMTLSRLGRGKDILCLWLDCDKEGENICYEVICNVYPNMNKKNYQQIYRAHFSSLTKSDLKAAFNKLQDYPNKNESSSVDARQVIDLKIGVSFTRFLTSAVLPGLKNTDLKLLSYGPCQTPTLWFCVNRQNEIDKFRAKEFFKVLIEIEVGKTRQTVYYRHKINDKKELNNFMKNIQDEKMTKVVKATSEKKVKPPPVGLNTVQLLRIASSYLKMSPHTTMIVAEKLYTMGYITYPRTETTKYAASYDFVKTLQDYSIHQQFGKQVSALLKNFKRPVLRGVDVGDHPPITPSRVANPGDLKGDQWELYEFICNTFFASLSEGAEYEETVYELDVNNNIFECDSSHITKQGFLTFMPWKAKNYIKDFPVLTKETTYKILRVASESHWTQPPDHLSESDLIKLMEHNKIGTDASMPVHIENICERGYVKVDGSRRLIPTKLGKALIEALSNIDPEIVQPTIRSEIENLVSQIAKGSKRYDEVLKYAIDVYKKKFLVIRQHYERLLNSFKKYFEIDLLAMNQVYKTIKNKNEALKIQNQVKKE